MGAGQAKQLKLRERQALPPPLAPLVPLRDNSPTGSTSASELQIEQVVRQVKPIGAQVDSGHKHGRNTPFLAVPQQQQQQQQQQSTMESQTQTNNGAKRSWDPLSVSSSRLNLRSRSRSRSRRSHTLSLAHSGTPSKSIKTTATAPAATAATAARRRAARAEALARRDAAFDFRMPNSIERMHTIGHIDIQMRRHHITCSNQVVHDILWNAQTQSIDANVNEGMQILCEASVHARRGGFQFILEKNGRTYFMVSELPSVMSVLDPGGGTRPALMRVLVRVRDGAMGTSSVMPPHHGSSVSSSTLAAAAAAAAAAEEEEEEDVTVDDGGGDEAFTFTDTDGRSDSTVMPAAHEFAGARTPTPVHLLSPSETQSCAPSCDVQSIHLPNAVDTPPPPPSLQLPSQSVVVSTPVGFAVTRVASL